MSAASPTSAASRRAIHREEMELALYEQLPLAEARDRLARRRWDAVDRRLAARRLPAESPPAERPRFWWQDQ